MGKSRPRGEGLGPRSKQNSGVLMVGSGALFTAVWSTTLDPAAPTASPVPLSAGKRKESSLLLSPQPVQPQDWPRPCENPGRSPSNSCTSTFNTWGSLQSSQITIPQLGSRPRVASMWPLTQAESQRSGLKGEALNELGGHKVSENSPMAPGTRSTPQSHKVTRVHFTDEETETWGACACHLQSQNKSMERRDWGPGIPV